MASFAKLVLKSSQTLEHQRTLNIHELSIASKRANN